MSGNKKEDRKQSKILLETKNMCVGIIISRALPTFLLSCWEVTKKKWITWYYAKKQFFSWPHFSFSSQRQPNRHQKPFPFCHLFFPGWVSDGVSAQQNALMQKYKKWQCWDICDHAKKSGKDVFFMVTDEKGYSS